MVCSTFGTYIKHLSPIYFVQQISMILLKDRCNQNQSPSHYLLSQILKSWSSQQFCNMSPYGSTVSILSNLTPRFWISSLHQTVLIGQYLLCCVNWGGMVLVRTKAPALSHEWRCALRLTHLFSSPLLCLSQQQCP